MNTGYILAIARGHNSGACLLKDGKIVFAIEEERLSRQKYDGGPFASMVKTLDYTDKIDTLVVAHTQTLADTAARVDFTGDDVYTGMARKLGLIDPKQFIYNHPQVVDLASIHHKLHAGCAFYRSGFDSAVALIVDGAGTFFSLENSGQQTTGYEIESIIDCDYPYNIKTLWKHMGTVDIIRSSNFNTDVNEPLLGVENIEMIVSDRAGITKAYEAVTEYCGFTAIEAGKTMGLFPYGQPNDKIPNLFETYENGLSLVRRDVIVPTYPNSAVVNENLFDELSYHSQGDKTLLQNRRDMAYALQTQTQAEMVKLIKKAVDMSGKKNVVISGGYGLNCVANYHYLDALKDEGINLYVEPISNDAGTSIGAALIYYHHTTQSKSKSPSSIYLGPQYNYTDEQIQKLVDEYEATLTEASQDDIVDLLEQRNIITIFQGRCENGPRALGNRSVLYDPSDPNGKDFVNSVKKREYFRPFAGSILLDDVHDWFDLRGMKDSPHMMYAVNCQPGIAEKIPSIIHEDGTCRIQTVSKQENENYYNLISAWKERTGLPIVFNTSFNLGGEPLVETLKDALWTLQQSDIEYLYLPEYGKLVTLKNTIPQEKDNPQ